MKFGTPLPPDEQPERVPVEKRCPMCEYRDINTKSCSYFVRTGHTRTFLHQGETTHINSPCKEFKSRTGKHEEEI